MNSRHGVSCKHQGNQCFNLSKKSFNKFKNYCLRNNWLEGKYAIFVHGKLEAIGDYHSYLVKQMYEKYGNITMYVGEITKIKRVCLIETTHELPLVKSVK